LYDLLASELTEEAVFMNKSRTKLVEITALKTTILFNKFIFPKNTEYNNKSMIPKKVIQIKNINFDQ